MRKNIKEKESYPIEDTGIPLHTESSSVRKKWRNAGSRKSAATQDMARMPWQQKMLTMRMSRRKSKWPMSLPPSAPSCESAVKSEANCRAQEKTNEAKNSDHEPVSSCGSAQAPFALSLSSHDEGNLLGQASSKHGRADEASWKDEQKQRVTPPLTIAKNIPQGWRVVKKDDGSIQCTNLMSGPSITITTAQQHTGVTQKKEPLTLAELKSLKRLQQYFITSRRNIVFSPSLGTFFVYMKYPLH